MWGEASSLEHIIVIQTPSYTATSSLHCCAGIRVTTNRSARAYRRASSTVIRVAGLTVHGTGLCRCKAHQAPQIPLRSTIDRSVDIFRLSARRARNVWRTRRKASAAAWGYAGLAPSSIRRNKPQGAATLLRLPQSRPSANATRLEKSHGTQVFEKGRRASSVAVQEDHCRRR